MKFCQNLNRQNENMDMKLEYDVIIPVYRPDDKLNRLMKALLSQSLRPRKIILINTEREEFLKFSSEEAFLRLNSGEDEGTEQDFLVELHHIKKSEFNHGATRNFGVSLSTAPFFVCMTDDAIPANHTMMEELLKPFSEEKVGISYGRQLPASDCGVIERYTRDFNYPEKSYRKTAEDLPRLGIKTFFASNVCAAYRRSYFDKLGGFPMHTIFNEDMIYARHLIDAGYTICYSAAAQVIHSHNYSGMEQFHRNFDLGVSHAQFPQEFSGIKAESEGKKLVMQTCRYLMGIHKPWLIVKLIWQSGCKYMGYFLGKRYNSLPKSVVRWCSMNRSYWT